MNWIVVIGGAILAVCGIGTFVLWAAVRSGAREDAAMEAWRSWQEPDDGYPPDGV